VRGALAREGWERRIRVPARRRGEGNPAIAKLYARERVADLEARSVVGERFESEIEEIGLKMQIATRLTSWVAIDERRRATGPTRAEDVPQELPYGTSAQSFGLRGAGVQVFGESPMSQSVDFGELEQIGALSMRSMSASAPPPAQPASMPSMMGYGGPAGMAPPSAKTPSPAAPAQPVAPKPSRSVAFSKVEKRALDMPEAATLRRKAGLPIWLLLLLLLALLAALTWWLVL